MQQLYGVFYTIYATAKKNQTLLFLKGVIEFGIFKFKSVLLFIYQC